VLIEEGVASTLLNVVMLEVVSDMYCGTRTGTLSAFCIYTYVCI
jgi:hypothetical protein